MSSTSLIIAPMREEPSLCPIQFGGARSRHYLQTESILIFLAMPGSDLIPMRVLESDSIASVKLRIQTSKGFMVKNQKLVCDGRELARSYSSIRDYGLMNGNVLHLPIRVSDLLQINVETNCGKRFDFKVEKDKRVGYVKKRIAEPETGLGFDPAEQELLFEGEKLEDNLAISQICKNDSIIHLFIRKPAKVTTRRSAKDFELSAFKPGNEIPSEKLAEQETLVEPVVINPEVEFPDSVLDMIRSVDAGLKNGFGPVMTSEGSGGAYFMHDESGRNYAAVFKPLDEEPMAENNPRGLPFSTDGEGLKRGTRVGQGAFREVAAFLLDHPIDKLGFGAKKLGLGLEKLGLGEEKSGLGEKSGFGEGKLGLGLGFAGVPATVLVRCWHRNEWKVGSLQKFVKNNGSSEEMGPRVFPVEEVHKIAVLDVRLANADRHAGNVLVRKDGERIGLVPIDHGYCLPENFEDCTFEWLYWPQAKEPFNEQTIDYIKTLDAEKDISLLKHHGWELPFKCQRVLRITTMLLKKGAERNLTPFEIGRILCRENLKKESGIETILREAEDSALPGSRESVFLETVSEFMDRYLDPC
ncbi:hypothetical protein LUZ60_012641 [Juncus effusus]|nr:hypothetical protein LUZ60_012641 [Juncus effusus]